MEWSRSRIAVRGSPASVFHDSAPEVQEELEQRPYLRNPHAVWDPDRQQIVIELEDRLEAGTIEAAELGVNDDVSDTVSACIADWEAWDLHILDVSPV
jgi:hypothetical protein